MFNLIPRDYWACKPSDMVRGWLAAMHSSQALETLVLDGVGDCIPLRSGRAALVAGLKSLQLPPGARIGVPLYCCPIVFRAVIAAGFKPRFIDVDPDTYCISASDLSDKQRQVDAVLAVHMFGNVCDIAGVRSAAPGKPVLEDCAQAIGSLLDGRAVGTLGDVAAFSFRSGKYLSVGEGGAVFSNRADLRSRLTQGIASLAVPTRVQECAHVAVTHLKSALRRRPLYGLVGHALWNRVNRSAKPADESDITMSQIRRSDLAIIRRRLPHLKADIARQRANAEVYSREMQACPGMLCPEAPGRFYNRYLYPILFAAAGQRDMLASHMLSHRVDSMKYLDQVAEVGREYYGYVGDCPVAESLAKRVLILPSYHSLSMAEVKSIARAFNAGWLRAQSCS